MNDSSAHRDPLERLADEFVARYRGGQRPSLTEYAERHPELAEQIRELFPALVELEQLKPISPDPTGAFVPAAKRSEPERIGEFHILRRVGHGGMGVVYEAVQESLGRRVALKLLPAEALADPKRLERFRREAKAAARLHHTNIVPVFGVGETDGQHYYAMQFIDGHPLDAVIHEIRRLKEISAGASNGVSAPVSQVAAALMSGTFAGATQADELPRETPRAPPAESMSSSPAVSGSLSDGGRHYWDTVARIGAQLADALGYAHGQGVLHRDIKPANLLLDLHGTVWVTDFGLAKAEGTDDLTRVGELVGTLRYTAPERFDGKEDHRADLYSLGLTLYELLTLRPAFGAENRPQLMEQVMSAAPPAPRSINPAIPRDLETVVLKAIARDPALRYQSATELAEDLRRFSEDRPIQARRASRAEQAWRWCRRNPAVASLLTMVLLVFALGATVSTVLAFRAAKQAQVAADERNRANDAAVTAVALAKEANSERAKAEAERARAQREGSLRALDLGQALLEQGDGGRGMLWVVRGFEAAPNGPAGDDLRRVAWAILATGHTQVHTLVGRLTTERDNALLIYSPDGKYFALGPDLAVYDAASRQRVWAMPGRQAHGLAFSKNGATLWTGSALGAGKTPSGEIARWETATGKPAGPSFVLPSAVWSLALHPDGTTLLCGCADGTLHRWDLSAAKEIPLLHKEKHGITNVVFSPNGKRFLTSSGVAFKDYYGGTVREPVLLWDAETFRPTGIKFTPTGPAVRAVFTQDSKRVLLGCNYGSAVWEVETGKQVKTLPGGAVGVGASPDGRLLATGGHDYKGRLLRADNQEVDGNLLFQNGWLWTAAFSPNSRMLATGGYNRFSFWRLRAPLEPAPAPIPLAAAGASTLGLMGSGSPLDGSLLVAAALMPGRTAPVSLLHEVSHAAFSADGTIVALRQKDWPNGNWSLQGWNTITGLPAGPAFAAPAVEWWANCCFAPDGRTLVCPCSDGTVRRWDVYTGKAKDTWDHQDPVVAVAVAPDGQTIASGSKNGTIRLWDAAGGKGCIATRSVFTGRVTNSWVHGLSFAPDGKTLAAGTWHFKTYLWDTPEGPLRPIVRSSGAIVNLRYSPNGRHLALAAAGDDVVTLHDAQTGARTGPPLSTPGAVFSLAFSPDGLTLATGCGDTKVRLWDVVTGRRLGAPLPCRSRVVALSFVDDRTLLSADRGGVLRWNLHDPRPPSAERLRLWVELSTGMALDQHGGVEVLNDLASRQQQLAELGGPPGGMLP